jgi:uracil permease
MKNYVDVEERLPLLKTIPLSLQHLFAMVGATILVPIILGMSPSIALFASGVGTLIYILCTKAKLPAYVGSSFAFIAPMLTVMEKYGVGSMLFGIMCAGFIYVIVAGIIKLIGINWLNKALPPVVVGSVVIVIGLGLAAVAVGWAGLGGNLPDEVVKFGIPRWKCILVAMITLATAVFGTMYFKGFLGVIPILISMVVGYISALLLGVVPQSAIELIAQSFKPENILHVPNFQAPKFNINAMLIMAPVAFVTLAEHIGHVYVTNNVVGRDFTKEPGLHRSILGDGLATIFAGFVGGPPNTTYGENISVMAITRIYSVWVIGIAGVIAIILSFIAPVAVVLENMPKPVMGGASILLFGIIASSGFRVFVEDKIDFGKKKNLLIASVIIVLGIGGAALEFPVGDSMVKIEGVALATLVGVILNLVLPNVSNTEKDGTDEKETTIKTEVVTE